MDYKFYLNDTEIEEPLNWSEFEIDLTRDDTFHGMQFEAGVDTLQFYGTGANYLISQKQQFGISADVTFIADFRCDENADYENVYSGKLNFGKYKDSCGNQCTVQIPVEEQGCKVVLNNRFDQDVDLDSLICKDNITVLPNYNQLGKTITMPAKAIDVRSEGYVLDAGDTLSIDQDIQSGFIHIRPIYGNLLFNNILTGNVDSVESNLGINEAFPGAGAIYITPQLLYEDNTKCYHTSFTYTFRLKGTLTFTHGNNFSNAIVKLRFLEFVPTDDNSNLVDGTVIQEIDISPGTPVPWVINYDHTFTGSYDFKQENGYYVVIEIGIQPGHVTFTNTFDKETYMNIENTKLCPDTTSQYYMVHEALSRVIESITDRCIRVKSSYYGRTDSQPFSFDKDGCGGLRFLTGGLKIRNAPNASFFANAQDLLEGLRAIDNIGFSIEDDPQYPGMFVMSIETIDEFYKDEQILFLPFVAETTNEVQDAMHYSKIETGYKKWQIQDVNGLNEFNSTREYRTNITAVSNTLDITSVLVAGSYPIEISRLQNFADSGAEDTTYDNEAFIICVDRNAYSFQVEQGHINSPSDIFDPGTVYNYRLSPLRNLMRWFKSIINGYANIVDTQSKLFFNSGTANYVAAGTLDDNTTCKIEKDFAIAEDSDVTTTLFKRADDYTPLWKNETSTFDYPLSIAEYKKIKLNPYGYIAYTCGNQSSITKGFIKSIKFTPATGMATFTLLKKWGS